MKCPYCGKDAKWCENKEIYGRNYGKSYMCYFCKPCDAYVGCHNNTERPLGIIANAELRALRKKVHLHMDPYWKSKEYGRGFVYCCLSKELGFQYHTGESNIETCNKVLNINMEKLLTQSEV